MKHKSNMLLFLLLTSVAASPKVLYPSKGVGTLQCEGDCEGLSRINCVGTPVQEWFSWECHNIPEYLEGRVNIKIPHPYDTIVADVEDDNVLLTVLFIVGTIIMCTISPEFVFGYALAYDTGEVTIVV